MVAAAAAVEPRFDIGRVINRAFGVIGRNIAPFFLLSLLAQIPYLAFIVAPSLNMNVTTMPLGTRIAFVLVLAAAVLAWVVFTFVLQAALTFATVSDLNGKRASFGAALMIGLREILPLFAIAILTSFAVVLGMILLIVPGLILALAWSVVVPVRVVERTPIFDTFGRSAALTRNHRWAILGLYVIYFLIVLGVSMAAGVVIAIGGAATFGSAPTTGVMTGATIVSGLIQLVVRVLSGVIVSTIIASAYFELRSIKEGIGPEHLAAVFD